MKPGCWQLGVRGCLARTVVVCHAMLLFILVAAFPDENVPSNRSVASPTSTCADWTGWIPTSSAPAVVMQVVSKDYIDVERNFIRLMEMNSVLTRQDLYLMCKDEESVQYFESTMGIRCISVAELNLSSHAEIWILRVRVLSCLLESGQDVIMSDADALWLADPMQDFAAPSLVNSSIIASRAHYPEDLGDQWGSTICMGFVLFRTTGSGAIMREFMAETSRLVVQHFDDQVAANLAASQLGIEWDNQGSDMNFEQSKESGFGAINSLTDDQGRPFTVALLPHNKYTRHCWVTRPSDVTVVVAHCLSAHKPGAKVEWMREAGLWSEEDKNL